MPIDASIYNLIPDSGIEPLVGIPPYDQNAQDAGFFDAYMGKDSVKPSLFSNIKGKLSGVGSGGGGAALMAGAGLLGTAIAGGYSNKFADFASQAGDVVGSFNPIAGAAVKLGSGVLNRLIGTKVNQEKLNAANQGTNYLNSYQSNASYFDDVKGPEAQAAVQDAYKGGLLVGGSARKKNQELRRQRTNSELYADRSVFNNVENIANTQMDNMLANYAAYGGPLSVGLFPKGGNGSIFGRVNWGQMYAEGGDLNQDNSNLDAQTLAAIANMAAEEEADGGPNKYHTRLSSTDERKYKKWMRDFTKSRKWNYYEQVDNPDYDYRGFWKNNPKEAQKMVKGDKRAHFTDRYKTPSHPTFSNESIYSNDETPGGQWRKDRNGRDVYVPSEYTAQFRNRTINEFQRGYENGESPTGYYDSSTGKTIYPTKYKKNTRRNTRRMAFGGSLHTAGTDWSNGLIEIDNGGSHEESPMEGVPFGIAEDGQPNLVEEGEVIFNDYVFSDRLKVPKAIRNMYKLRGQKDLTYAEAAKKIAKESEERPNDPISQRGLEALLGDLQAAQEQSRQEMAMEEAAQERAEQSDILGAVFAANGGKITIKPSKRGTFTAEAIKHKMGVQEFAEEVLSNPGAYSPGMVKKANFARNAASWKHAFGGPLDIDDFTFGHKFSPGGSLAADDGGPLGDEYLTELLNFYDKDKKAFKDLVTGWYKGKALPRQIRGKNLTPTNVFNLANSGSPGTAYRAIQAWGKPRIKITNEKKAVNKGVTPLDPLAYHYLRYNWDKLPKGKGENGKYNNPYLNLLTPSDRYDFDKITSFDQYLALLNEITSTDKSGKIGAQSSLYRPQKEAVGRINDYFRQTELPSHLKDFKYDNLDEETKALADKLIKEMGIDLTKVEGMTSNEYLNSLARSMFSSGLPIEKDNNFITGTEEYLPFSSKVLQEYVPGFDRKYEKGESYNDQSLGNLIFDLSKATVPGNTGDVDLMPLLKIQEPKIDIKPITREEVVEAFSPPKKDFVPLIDPSKLENLRYVPALGAGMMAFSDLMGWSNKPDYSSVNALLNAGNSTRDVRATPIGDYMKYTPLDRLYYANQLGAQAGATRRNIMNTSGGNRGAAMAGLLGADNTALSKFGELYRQGEEYNFNLYKAKKEYDKATNLANAENFLKAQTANKENDKLRLDAVAKAEALRDQIDQRIGASRSANLTNLFDNLGKIGIDTYNRNDRDMLINTGYFHMLSDYMKPRDWNADEWKNFKDRASKVTGIKYKKGGKLNKKKKGLTI